MGLQRNTSVYRRLQGYTRVNRGLQWNTTVKTELQGDPRVAGNYNGILGREPTWRFHTKLYKFRWNSFPNNAGMKNRTDLNLGEVLCLSIIYHIPDSWLPLLNGDDFYFRCKPPIVGDQSTAPKHFEMKVTVSSICCNLNKMKILLENFKCINNIYFTCQHNFREPPAFNWNGFSGFVINASNKMLFTLCQFRSALYWYIIAPHIFRTFSIQKQKMLYIFTSAITWNSFHGGVFPADPLW